MMDGDFVRWVKDFQIFGHCIDQSVNGKASDSNFSLYIF